MPEAASEDELRNELNIGHFTTGKGKPTSSSTESRPIEIFMCSVVSFPEAQFPSSAVLYMLYPLQEQAWSRGGCFSQDLLAEHSNCCRPLPSYGLNQAWRSLVDCAQGNPAPGGGGGGVHIGRVPGQRSEAEPESMHPVVAKQPCYQPSSQVSMKPSEGCCKGASRQGPGQAWLCGYALPQQTWLLRCGLEHACSWLSPVAVKRGETTCLYTGTSLGLGEAARLSGEATLMRVDDRI